MVVIEASGARCPKMLVALGVLAPKAQSDWVSDFGRLELLSLLLNIGFRLELLTRGEEKQVGCVSSFLFVPLLDDGTFAGNASHFGLLAVLLKC